MVGEPLCVSLDELRRAIDVLLDHVEAATAGETVALDKDYFWSIPPGELYDVYNKPADLTIGQLSECWQHLKDLLADSDGALGYHLVWLADILRAMGHEIS
ncbi:hypothetical protein IU459_04135 [Nocardia amamiensis]|uniref:Uncharacterized protein n=1 Tax=Nocardia amamiensis TaxID=404578 RepID=A0ABS0CJG0_9NOCA|nr:hypothetical protein [Nocardia amamiensis]MBF6296731.1 hypothetical protein [Nocardia amamiensis]